MTTNTAAGLFLASYTISNGMAGAPIFDVQFTVDTVRKTILGVGQIKDTSNPPLNIQAKLCGTYTQTGDEIVVSLTDFSSAHVIHPVIPEVKLSMTLDSNWQSGTATYTYKEPNSLDVHTIQNATVTNTSQAASANGALLSTNASEASLFIASYLIGKTDVVGAPQLTVNLGFNAALHTVVGQGSLFLDTPTEFVSYLDGTYTYMTVMPNNTHISIVLTGYPVAPNDSANAAVKPNLQLQMVLQSDWQSGVGTYTYTDQAGQSHTVSDVPVTKTTPATR